MNFHTTFLKKIPLLLFLALFFYLSVPLPYPMVSEKKPLLLFGNQCDENLRTLFISALKKAKSSIFLKVYSLNDPEVIKILEKKKKEGVAITIKVDSKNNKGFDQIEDMVTLVERKSSLMHQKILVIDESWALIGSANFTSSSLRIHDNLVVALWSEEVAKSLIDEHGGQFLVGDHKIELYLLPQENKSAYARVVSLLESAQKSLEVAMFTWTHPELTQAIIDAKRRGLKVQAIIDQNNAIGVSKKATQDLLAWGVNAKMNIGSPMLHHKCCLIDKETLIMGSANWTKAAFSKNDECVVIIHNLTKKEKTKLEKLWHAMRATSITPSSATERWES